ncbi:MAG: PKD domain-containing protein [Bdellovibrio sp.]|nr:PKD domain-containing protein [Bdellovibrio sp.]
MKKIYLSVVLLVISLLNTAFAQNGPHVVELAASKASYSVGEKAVLLAHVRVLPDNPNYEVFLEAKFNNQVILITRLSDKESASVTPTLTSAGNFPWEVKAYTQDKYRAHELEGGIAYHETTIRQAQNDLLIVTDPEQRALLIETITESNEILIDLRSELFNLRTLVEIATLQVQVTNKQNKLDPPTFFIEPDHASGSYDLGERSTFFIHVLSTFEGQETQVRSTFKGNAISVTKSSESEFVSVTQTFTTQDNGEQIYTATLLVRDKNEADALRSAISSGTNERNKFIQLKDQTSDPVLKSYYQKRIDELSSIVTALYQTLENALTSIGEKSATIHVGTGGCGSGSGGQDPIAVINAPVASGTAPLHLVFDGHLSHDPDGQVIRFDWDVIGMAGQHFPDNGPILDFTFATAGDYSVQLIVTDNEGRQNMTSIPVHVTSSGGSGSGSGGPCIVKTDYPAGIVCELTAEPFVASNPIQLDEYLHTYGQQGVNVRSLKINFHIPGGDLVVHSPCEIILESGITIIGSSLCLDGQMGIRGTANSLTAPQTTLLSAQGNVNIGSGTQMNVGNLSVNAPAGVRIGANSTITASTTINVVSQSTDPAVISSIIGEQSVHLTGREILMQTNGPGIIGAESIIETSSPLGFVFNASPCSIPANVQIIGVSSGSCFP